MEIYWMVTNPDTWLEKSQLTKRCVSGNNSMYDTPLSFHVYVRICKHTFTCMII